MSAHIPINQVMRSKLLLGDFFAGPSWDRWKAVSRRRTVSAQRDRARHVHRGRRSVTTDQAGARVHRRCGARRWQGQHHIAGRNGAAVWFDPKGRLRPGE